MFWWIYFIFNLLLIIIFIKPRKKLYFLPGILACTLMYLVDSTAVKLNLYEFYGFPQISSLPILYLLSGFSLGIIFWGLRPKKQLLWLYILVISLLFTGVEKIAELFGAYRHLNWCYWYSFFLNNIYLTTISAFVSYLNDLFAKE